MKTMEHTAVAVNSMSEKEAMAQIRESLLEENYRNEYVTLFINVLYLEDAEADFAVNRAYEAWMRYEQSLDDRKPWLE